ncbi:phage tail protein [Janthinobacterium sp. 61]|uniref:phage tail protein n=1 Tax=unclassified Janthinobacterium TaxID=2610881 RepID=UPI000C70C05D|nr:tail fiber protein [Janthinobacterium sp. 61]PKV45229.1 microcystin-dependent protein [Janthinobacterium sp. 61]
MTSPFLGEIQVFGFNYAPAGWASCNGATLQIRQYTALFSLIGTQYGGDGVTTFQLPNFTGRAPCGQGQGPALTARTIGDTFGSESVQLDVTQIPGHTHQLTVARQPNTSLQHNVPLTNDGLITIGSVNTFLPAAAPSTTFAAEAISPAGGNQAHENRQPLLALNFCIALQGEFPAFG